MGCKVRMRVSALLLFCCFNVDDVAKRREGSIQHSKMSRPRSGSRPLTSSVASCSPATAILGGGLLLALHLLSEYGLYARVRFDTSPPRVSINFNRPSTAPPPIHQRGYWRRFASRFSCLKRGLVDEPLLEIGLWQPARATTAKLGTMGRAAATLPPLIIALLALGVSLITLMR